jgi:hypothetical protein
VVAKDAKTVHARPTPLRFRGLPRKPSKTATNDQNQTNANGNKKPRSFSGLSQFLSEFKRLHLVQTVFERFTARFSRFTAVFKFTNFFNFWNFLNLFRGKPPA